MKIQEVTDLIMSPGCSYTYTLTLCPSSEAAQMKELVKDKILRGESKEQILSYFEQVYGPRILAQPAKKGFYFVAWWFPYFLLFDAVVLVGVILVI
jgi:cytochrome c-type biogenesis protein CcmH